MALGFWNRLGAAWDSQCKAETAKENALFLLNFGKFGPILSSEQSQLARLTETCTRGAHTRSHFPVRHAFHLVCCTDWRWCRNPSIIDDIKAISANLLPCWGRKEKERACSPRKSYTSCYHRLVRSVVVCKVSLNAICTHGAKAAWAASNTMGLSDCVLDRKTETETWIFT